MKTLKVIFAIELAFFLLKKISIQHLITTILFTLTFIFYFSFRLSAQSSLHVSPSFNRIVLASGLNRPWEMLYGPDSMLWITQTMGRVSRVDPNSGVVSTIYTAPDYFGGVASQSKIYPCNATYATPISSGTYGLALHPDFETTPYVYFIYSYNAGSSNAPVSKYKVRRFTWQAENKTANDETDVITDLPLDRYHEGMRLLIIKQSGVPYIYITAGDGTVDDDRCYTDQNDNLRAQDWNSKFGKILRYNIDGSVPATNPIANSPVFTQGHRNPLGLVYNPSAGIIYSSENGKSTDDEINIIERGKNYGWPKARGYHNDANYPGEADFVSGYVPSFAGDELKEALYSWSPATVTIPEDPQNTAVTGVVAPSDMIYYPDSGIAEFRNSLMVTTLKNFNPAFKASVYVFKLNNNGTGLDASHPSPQVYFSIPDDAAVPGSPDELRYRDIATTPDGKTIFISTDTWAGQDNKIIKFVYQTGITSNADLSNLELSTGALTPSFSSSVLNYTQSISSGVTTTIVTPTASVGATIKVNGNTVLSDNPSLPIELLPGNNIINIVVTAQDGTNIKTYTVTVITPQIIANLGDHLPGNATIGHPGDIITYEDTIKNMGANDAVNVTLVNPAPIGTIFNAGSLKTSALARDDNFLTALNTVLNSGNVLTNDFGLPSLKVVTFGTTTSHGTITIAGSTGTTDAGGTLTVNVNGTFSYMPPQGFSGTDKFTYTATTSVGLPNNNAVVTITVGSVSNFNILK